MSWADRTYWVAGSTEGSLEYAISSDLGPEELAHRLDLNPDRKVLVEAIATEPCRSCFHFQPCMDSVWVDGKRMAGPGVGEASFSEVLLCYYCTSFVLNLYRGSDTNAVSDKCPRRTERVGECDGCHRFRAALVEKTDPATSDKLLAQLVLGTALSEPDLQAVLEGLPEGERGVRMRRVLAILCGLIHVDADAKRIVRALVLEMCDGPLAEAWMARSPATRRFSIRCWEGVVRTASQAS